LVDEALLIFLVPFLLGLAGALLKALLELVVGDVVVVPVFDQRAAQLLTEPGRELLVRRMRDAIGPLDIELRGGSYFMVPMLLHLESAEVLDKYTGAEVKVCTRRRKKSGAVFFTEEDRSRQKIKRA
jgi:hypothetical protein